MKVPSGMDRIRIMAPDQHHVVHRAGLNKQTGYVTTDNSGRGNIFPTSSKPFYKSPTSEKVASQGLGGLQGERSSMLSNPAHLLEPCACVSCAALGTCTICTSSDAIRHPWC